MPSHIGYELFGNLELALLPDRGANADAKSKEGKAPSQVASGKRKNEIVQMLTEYGAVQIADRMHESKSKDLEAKEKTVFKVNPRTTIQIRTRRWISEPQR